MFISYRRRCIALRNLDEEFENVFKFSRTSKYEVGAAEWNPTSHNKELCALSVSDVRLLVGFTLVNLID